MILGNPLLDDLNELLTPLSRLMVFVTISFASVFIVINHVPFPPASVEIITVRVCRFSNRELNHIKRNPVVSSADDPIASTCNRHFCGLECSIVGSRETPVCRRSVQRRISQIATDDGPQPVQFLFRCRMSLNFVICE